MVGFARSGDPWRSSWRRFEDGRLTGGFNAESTPGASPLVVLYAADLDQMKAAVDFHFVDPGGNELAVWSER